MTSEFIDLPLDVLVNVITRLKPKDVRNLMRTCKTLNDLIKNESSIMRQIFRNKLILQNRNSEENTYSWYHRCRIAHNWHKGIYKKKIIIQHNANYMPWLQFLNSEMLYLSVGKELRCYKLCKKGLGLCTYLWSVEVPTVKRDDIRTNDISRFVLKDNVFVCGNRDGSVAVYELIEHGANLVTHIKNCHDNGSLEVSAVERINNSIITISLTSPQVCFWNYNTDEPNDRPYSNSRNIKVPDEIGCRCIAVNKSEDKLAIGLNGNSKPTLIDAITGSILMTSEETRGSRFLIRDIQWHDENSIVGVSHSGRLQLVDVRSHEVAYVTSDPFLSSLFCVKTDSNRGVVIGSSEYSRCTLFDLRSTQHVQMYFTLKKPSCIYSLDFDSTRLLAAADRSVVGLNFNVNVKSTRPRDYSQAFEIIYG